MSEHRITSTTSPTHIARCASCGRFVGPYAACPYCGAKMAGRLSMRWVKCAAVLLATLGLIGLWIYARTTDIPTLSAADVQGTMNMAYVRITGRVTRSRSYDPESGYLAFWVQDGTGEVRVSAYRDVTESLIAANKVPALGDLVQVAGTLRIREDYVALTLNVPEHLELKRPDPISMQAGELTLLDENLRVRVTGEVQHVNVPYEGLTLIILHDASGEVTIAIDETTLTLANQPLPEIVEGQGIEVEGTVTLYKDTPQITPADITAVLLSEVPAETTVTEIPALNQVSATDAGTWVKVHGHIVAMEGLKGGLKAILDDGTAQLTLLVWQSVYEDLPSPDALDVDADIEVEGEIQLYQGELEIIPEVASDLAILSPAPDIPWIEIDDLGHLDAGRLVRLRGILEKPQGFSAGIKVPLNDGTGKITVLLWSNIATQLTPEPVAGLPVEVRGIIEVYNQELEIIPRSPHDWRVE